MTEETFTRELQRRADDIRSTPLSFEDVHGRARSIRRRRRGAAMAAAAIAIVAIAVPTAIISGSSDTSRAPEPAPPVSPMSPGASVLHDGVVTLPDGSTVSVDLDNEDVMQFGVLTDGRIVAATQKPYAVFVYAADGQSRIRYPVAANAITMSPDDRLVAWTGDDFRTQVLESGVAEPTTLSGIPMPGESAGSIDAVLGSDCANGGCTAFGGDYSTSTSVLTSSELATDLTTSEPLRVTGISPSGDLWAVGFPPGRNEQFGCSGLYDPEAGQVTARTCDTSNLTFSPDGEHLIGTRGDNNMAGEVTVLDSDLAIVDIYSPAPQVISRSAWADATHVLAVVAGIEDSQWSVVHVPVDGSDPEVVAGPTAGPNPELYPDYLPSQ